MLVFSIEEAVKAEDVGWLLDSISSSVATPVRRILPGRVDLNFVTDPRNIDFPLRIDLVELLGRSSE